GAFRDRRQPVAEEEVKPSWPGPRADLHGQVALVTGASQGIGLAIAEMLAAAGADIALNHFGATAEIVGQASRAVRQSGRRGLPAVKCDVASRAEAAAMVKRAVEEFGRIDVLVNNAGIAPECPLQDLTDEIWDRVLSVNLKAQFLVCQAVVPHMRAAGYGRI